MTRQTSPKLALFFLSTLLNLILALDYPSFNGYQFLDLTSKNLETFYLETQKWTATGLSGSTNSSLCGSNNPILGGSGTWRGTAGVSKTYSALPTHTAIYYQITFSFIDKFKPGDQLILKLDTYSIPAGNPLKNYNPYLTSSICGSSDADTTQFAITGSMPHTANTLVLQSTFKLTGTASLGIRDIQLTFVNDSSVTIASSCVRVFDSQLVGISGECSCVKGSYLSSSTCTACNAACQNCFGPSPSHCFACVSGYSFTGSQCIQCDSSCLTCSRPGSLQCMTCKDGYWLQANGSCTATCDLPASTRQVVGSLQVCYSSCTSSQYILWDGTCVNNCSSPLVNGTSGTNKLCNKPCKTGEYIYKNGSCIAGCSAPFLASTLNGVSTCNKPCQTGDYLYWNSSCVTGCGSPLVSSINDTVLTCSKPCQTGEYLYWNGSCLTGCNTPLLSSTSSDSILTCNKPCQTGDYLNWNNNCIGECGVPFLSSTTSDGILLCKKPCQSHKYLYQNSSCIATCSAPFSSSNTNGIATCNKPCQTGEHLYWNSSCIVGCAAPLLSSTTNDGILACNKPCLSGLYLYENSSCIAGCNAPFLSSSASDGFTICNKPCQTGEYLYWNGSCLGGCSTPLLFSTTSDSILTCNTPCQTGESLYWNNSCLATCPAPLLSSTFNDVSFCNQPCESGEYLNWNNLCLASCPTPLLSSVSNNVPLCSKPCPDNNQFLYVNGSCLATCPSPYISSITNGVTLCNEPCQNNEYLYWNGDCNPACSAPLVSSSTSQGLFCNKPCGDFEYLYEDNSCQTACPIPYLTLNNGEISLCNKPCNNNEFLDWNNACITSCLPPLVSSTDNGVALCQKPCSNNEFLYSDGSCLSSCPSPFKSSSTLNVDLCQAPCSSSSQFLYPDDSCSVQCSAPLISSTPADGIKRCASPCLNPSNYYYNTNNTCGTSCSSPGTIQTIEFLQVCYVTSQTPSSTADQNSLSSDDKKSADQIAGATKAAGKAASAGATVSSLISSQSSGAVTLISLIKMLEYIRYMNIDYPPKLEYIMSSQNGGSISLNFDVSPPERVEKKFPEYPLPGKFGKYRMLSSFIVNYWEALFTLGILLLILAASILLASQAKDVKYVGTCSAKIRDIIKWNFFLIVLCGNIDSVGVFSSLEFRTTHLSSFLSVLGTLVCIFINLLVVYLMLLIPYIIYSLRKARRRKVIPVGTAFQSKNYQARFALCGVLFMNFKQKYVLQHSCMFFILIRVYFFNIIIGYLFEYPLAQAILITIMSIMMLGYFILARPFKNPLELIKTMTYETIIAAVNICVLILAIMDHNGIKNQKQRVQLGDVIILSNMLFNLMAVSFIIVELIVKIIKVYKLRKTITAKSWRYWLTIITFLLEPEELEMEDEEAPEKDIPLFRIPTNRATKLQEEKPPSPPKKNILSFEDQTGHESDTPLDRISSIPMAINSPALRLNFNRVSVIKTTSTISFDTFNDMTYRNLLSPANTKTSQFFSNGQLSARSLLHNHDNQDNQSAANSPRLLPVQLSFQDLEQRKSANESRSLGTPEKLNEEKGILIQRNKSTEAYLRDRRRNIKAFSPSSISSSVIIEHEDVPDLSFEIGTGNVSGMNTPRQQSRFSKFLPLEKLKNMAHGDV